MLGLLGLFVGMLGLYALASWLGKLGDTNNG